MVERNLCATDSIVFMTGLVVSECSYSCLLWWQECLDLVILLSSLTDSQTPQKSRTQSVVQPWYSEQVNVQSTVIDSHWLYYKKVSPELHNQHTWSGWQTDKQSADIASERESMKMTLYGLVSQSDQWRLSLGWRGGWLQTTVDIQERMVGFSKRGISGKSMDDRNQDDEGELEIQDKDSLLIDCWSF